MSAYVGRFAPSPTGALHFGSLYAAVASYLDAKAHDGLWRLRIDDIDPPRAVAGSQDQITQTLATHQLHWDGEIILQSDHLEQYQQAIDYLSQNNMTYLCTCTRKQLTSTPIYPGHCRGKDLSATTDVHPEIGAIRLKVDATDVSFQDRRLGRQAKNLRKDVGDFIIQRRDKLVAYHLATGLDDSNGIITHVVRGADLLSSTHNQLCIMDCLSRPAPMYAHLPTIVDANSSKLSKQAHATPVPNAQAATNLHRVFSWLGLSPSTASRRWSCSALLDWAIEHWSMQQLPADESIVYE